MRTVPRSSKACGSPRRRMSPLPTGRWSLTIFFFFSSRRRHTRLQGDWSSDVCSSDLVPLSKMRIGYLKAEFESGTDEKQKALYREALDALRTAGANLEPIELPKFSTEIGRAHV